MSSWSFSKKLRRHKDLPTEVYISVVDSLHRDSRSLLMGSAAIAIAILLTAWKTGEVAIWLCGIAVALVACGRGLVIRSFLRHRASVTTTEEAKRWELRYAIGTCVHVALLGAWCIIAFAKTSDPFVHLVSLSSTIANLIGIAGRNFGSSRLVTLQILFAWPLIVTALLLARDIYYAIFAVLFVAFFMSMKSISDRLRQTLLDAVIATRDVTILAGRFDTALNNMPHGLCMFDAERRVVVSNKSLTKLLGVSSDISKGAFVRELLHDCVRVGIFSAAKAKKFAVDFEKHLSATDHSEIIVETQNGQTLALTFHPMENGGSVVLVEDVTERVESEARIRHLARYDALTGLPNRIVFREQMTLALDDLSETDNCAVLFIDLDKFKQVNDTLGHPLGDAVLHLVADRLRAVVRESDVLARFAGDEFVVLQRFVRNRDEVETLAQRIVTSLAETFDVDVHQVLIGASIGIAMAPQDGRDCDLLLKNADMALYRAKAEGRAAWRFFEPEMDAKAQARRNLELELRDAFASGAFEVHYQPLFNLRNYRVSTCEALLRWPHPTRGMVSPAEFIPVAEEMGLIVEIGNWVLHKACAECMKWPANVRVAVNLSPIQFKRGNVAAVIRHALAASGLSADRLEVEITESSLLEDTEATRATLEDLREFGVRISLDDFGTGHSSLSYLHSFPLNKVKIDRSFLQGIGTAPRSLTLLRGIASLSAELGMSVTVEGIETEEQLMLVASEKNIDEAQGFIFSPALPSSSIRRLLAFAPARAEKVA